MKKEIKDKLPQWYKEINRDANLILGDDSDSLLSCNLLTYITNGKWNVNYFYDFQNVYENQNSKLPMIGVDMAFNKGMTFDNHLTKKYSHDEYNNLSVNLNNAFDKHRNNYCEKYPFSTLITIWSLYEDYFGINGKVKIDDNGNLHTNIELEEIQTYLDFKLELPQGQFHLHKQFKRMAHTYYGKKPESISFAFTGKNYISYTVKEA